MQGNQFLSLPNQNQNFNPNFGAGVPELSLDKPLSSYTYQSKRAKKQHWMNLVKHNKKLDTDILLKNYKISSSASKSFLITLFGAFGIPINSLNPDQAPIQGSKYSVEYYMTLFNKDIGTHGSFYGRTYRSKSIEVTGSTAQIDTKMEDHVYFHTSYVEKSSYLVVEIVIVRDLSGQKSYSSAGYALCPLFEFGGTTNIELTRGSPRSICQVGLQAQATAQKSAGRFQFEIRDFPTFDALKQLIPQNCFCSPNDDVPGILGDKPPIPRVNGKLVNNLKCEIIGKENIYLHNIQVFTSLAFESRFESFLRKMKQEKMRTAKGHLLQGGLDNVFISERRIIVSTHNSWQCIGSNAQNTLNPPNEQGVSSATSSITLKDFISHPLMAILFRIEYQALLPSNTGNDSCYFTVGWTCHLPAINKANRIQDEVIDAEIELGPGSAPSGDLLWDPNAEDINYYQLKIRAVLSASPLAPNENYDQKNPIRRHNPNEQPIYNQRPQMAYPTRANDQDNFALKEKHDQIKQLEDQLNYQAKLKEEADRRFEMLEIQRIKDASHNHQVNPHDAMERKYREEQQLLQLQKQQVQQELEMMRKNMRDYQDSLKDANMAQSRGMMQQYQQPQFYPNQQQPYPNQFQGGYNSQMQNSQQMSQNSQQQISMIGNVFYNMLNMIGENERDKRIIGLSDKLKKMIQTQRFDDLLAPKAPFVGAGMINLLRTTDLPLSDQINIIKMGQGDLLQHPTAQIVSDSIQKDLLNVNAELNDPLKASKITFKFLCYKSAVDSIEIPNKLYFQFKFFTFPSLISDKVKIMHSSGQDNFIKHGQVFYLQKEHAGANKSVNQNGQISKQLNQDTLHDPNLLESIFEIDPSLSKVKDENIRLANYLKERFLTVDVFDGDTLFLYGTCKIPLYELLRQGKQTIVRAKECEMCDPETGEFRGSLQLIMSNQGKFVSIQEIYDAKMDTMNMRIDQNSPSKSRLQPSQHDSTGNQGKYRKVIKSKPMDITKIQQTNNETNLLSTHVGLNTNYNQSIISQMSNQQLSMVQQQNADLRKKLRVDRVRKMTIGHSEASAAFTQVDDPSQPDWAKHKSLKEIEVIRETKRDQVLSRVLEEYTKTTEQLSIIPGVLEFYTCKVHNPFNNREVFSIHINDPDERFLAQPELQLVTDPNEWRYWVKQGKSQAPLSYEIIQRPADIMLNPNDEIELLFKYMTTRDVSIDPNDKPSQDIIKPRKIGIIIMQTNRKPHTAMEINIVPSSAIIDHTFRFYEPQNSHVTLQIPPFIQLYQQGLYAVSSKPNVIVDKNKDTTGFQVEAQTSDAPYEVDITLFVYGDQYREKLLATCQLEIYSMRTMYTKIKAGAQSTQSLELPAENARQVLIHSSNSKLVYLPRRELNKSHKIVPQMVNHISICAKTFLPTTQRVRVNCTDMNTGELVYQWLMIIDADQPTISYSQPINTKINYSSTHELFFENRLNTQAIYEFATSRPDLVQVLQDKIEYRPRETRAIRLNILAQSKFGVADVFLFANDMDYNSMQCIKLSITYLQLP